MQPQTHSHCRHHGYACFMPLVRIRQHTTRVCVKKHRQDRRGCSTPYSVLFGVSFGLQQTPPLPQHSLKWRTQHRKGSAPGVTLRVCMVLPGPAPCLHIWCPDLLQAHAHDIISARLCARSATARSTVPHTLVLLTCRCPHGGGQYTPSRNTSAAPCRRHVGVPHTHTHTHTRARAPLRAAFQVRATLQLGRPCGFATWGCNVHHATCLPMRGMS